MSVVRFALDTRDPVQRRGLEAMFWTSYQIRRALQRQARGLCRAYWAATHERDAGPAAVRERLGLSRTELEHAAYAHLDGATSGLGASPRVLGLPSGQLVLRAVHRAP